MTGHAPRVLFVGSLWEGSNTVSYWKAFLRLGCVVVPVNTAQFAGTPSSIASRARARLTGWEHSQHATTSLRAEMIRAADRFRPNILFASKATWIDPETLAGVSADVKVHFHPDDTANSEETTPTFFEAEPHWDLHLSSRQCNVDEALERGARDARRVMFAYDLDVHRPVKVDRTHSVAFVGNRRQDRVDLIELLAQRFGKRFVVCGGKWGRSRRLARSATIVPPQYGLAMAAVLNSSSAALGLLNSRNRDQHTYRSFEIPACGALLVAERTPEHSEMLIDGREALFFSSVDELLGLLDRVMADPPWASAIAQAGYRRITTGGNTFEHRIVEVLRHLGWPREVI